VAFDGTCVNKLVQVTLDIAGVQLNHRLDWMPARASMTFLVINDLIND
jgi:hypothetical protein